MSNDFRHYRDNSEFIDEIKKKKNCILLILNSQKFLINLFPLITAILFITNISKSDFLKVLIA